MKRFRRRAHRQALIDACRLIGWTIHEASDEVGPYTKEKYRYIVRNKMGNVLRHPSKNDPALFVQVRTFWFMWEAAAAALTFEGVNVDALKPSGETRRAERAARKVQRKRDQQERAARRVAEAQAAGDGDRRVRVIMDIETYGGNQPWQNWPHGVTMLGIVGMGVLVLTADRLLRRKIARHMKHRWSGCLITTEVTVLNNPQGQPVVSQTNIKETLLTPTMWWKCILPWPGKRKWAETVQAKAALLGATIEYQVVSAWDWDEAWVIEVDPENIIASSNRTATALSYLKYKGVPEA